MIQVIDEFNRPAKADYGVLRVPPPEEEVEALFAGAAGGCRTRASSCRRRGITWRRRCGGPGCGSARPTCSTSGTVPDLGEYGKIHVRYGKGSRGRGPKTRLVPAINQAGDLLDWWLSDVRHQFGDDYAALDAPLLPSERHDPATGSNAHRIGDQALRDGLANAVARSLPAWSAPEPAHAAAFLRVVDVCPRNGPQSHSGIAWP